MKMHLLGANMRRDGHVYLCMNDETSPFAYIMVEGTASLSADLDSSITLASILAPSYHGNPKRCAYYLVTMLLFLLFVYVQYK